MKTSPSTKKLFYWTSYHHMNNYTSSCTYSMTYVKMRDVTHFLCKWNQAMQLSQGQVTSCSLSFINVTWLWCNISVVWVFWGGRLSQRQIWALEAFFAVNYLFEIIPVMQYFKGITIVCLWALCRFGNLHDISIYVGEVTHILFALHRCLSWYSGHSTESIQITSI